VCANGHVNVERARFCTECGAPLIVAESQFTPEPGTETTAVMQGTTVLADTTVVQPKTPVNVRKWLIIAGAAVVGLILIGGGAYFFTTTPAADVVGMSESQAIAALGEQGFDATVSSKEFSDTVPKDSIASQDPAAGSRVGSGGTISLVLSRGPARTVPDVEGETFASATRSMSDASLESARTEEPSETVPKGTVILQNPSAGTQLEDGDTVELLVSSGPPVTTLTYVRDLSSLVSSASFLNCRLTASLWNITYKSAAVQNGSNKIISKIKGTWTSSSLNGTYYPCYVIGEFPDTPTTEDRYRVVFDPTKADRNSSAWYSNREMESENWSIGN